jgi:hypothetical protein
MSIIGDIVGTVAKAVLPSLFDSVGPLGLSVMPLHAQPEVPASSDGAAYVVDPVSHYVALHGLHSIARQ